MSTLGKIFTILTVVLAIFLCALMVGFVQSHQNWTKVIEADQKVQAQAMEAIRVLKGVIAAQNQQRDTIQQAYTMEIANRDTTIADKNDQILNAQKKLGAQDAQLTELTNTAKNLQENLTRFQESKTQLETDYNKQVALAKDLQTAKDQLITQLQDLRNQVMNSNNRVRELEVQLNESVKENNYLKQHAQAKLPEAVPVLPTVDLHGVVTEVNNQDKIASINLGSADQVVKGMTFYVSRGGNYLADLVITRVDENSSVGRLDTVTGAVQESDNVTYTFRR